MEPSTAIPQPSPLPSLAQDDDSRLLDLTPEKKLDKSSRVDYRSAGQRTDMITSDVHVDLGSQQPRLYNPALNSTAKLQHAVSSLRRGKISQKQLQQQQQQKDAAELTCSRLPSASRALKVVENDSVAMVYVFPSYLSHTF